jgi:hypothetical protein
MLKNALAGLWATCVLLTLYPGAVSAATLDVVLYSSDAANLHGNWARVPDITAAGGQVLSSVDKAWGTTNAPLASPADYFEFTFSAPANTSFHVWTRMRATSNSKFNDSVYAQFSDALDNNGAAAFGVGTTGGLAINLATDATGTSLSSWGWQDGAYWLSQVATVKFSSTGSHTLRIQTREDGVQIDQVVLSASTFLTSAPGSVSQDTKVVAKPVVTSTSYLGTPFAVPGIIAAQDFDIGGEGIAYHDSSPANAGGAYRQTDVDLAASSDGGNCVGWISPGEWTTYSVNVASAGSYLLEARVASYGPGGTFHVAFGGQDATGGLTIPNTGGWQNWTTVSKMVTLTAGAQSMRLVFDASATATSAVGNLNSVRLTRVASAPFTGSAAMLPGVLHAENFDDGGEGIAYHDMTPGNAGGVYRQSDVDVAACTDGGYCVGWIDTGEWLAYTVDVSTAGAYTLQFRVASAVGGGRFHAAFGLNNTTVTDVPNTGGWQNWTTVTTNANLAAGRQVMKLMVDAGGFNVSAITFALTLPPTPSVTAPNSPNVADGTIGVTVRPNLSWQAAGATSYDVRLGTTNPAATYVSNISTYYYAPSVLNSGTKYYWQIVAKNASGSTAGPMWSFTTEGAATPPPPPPPPPVPGGAPTSYSAVTDRVARPKPALPALGPAGFTFADPTYGSTMIRVTDANTRPTSPNLSFRTPSASPQVAWNSTSSYFYVVTTDGGVVPYAFDASAKKASRLPGSGDGGLQLNFSGEPTFSSVNADLIYGVSNRSNNRTVARYDFATKTYSTLVDLDTLVSGLADTYVGAVNSSGVPTEYMTVFFGGSSQDHHNQLMWFPVSNLGARKILDTTASTLNGTATNILLNFRLHAVVLDKSGRYVYIFPTVVDVAAPRNASPFYVWDTNTDIITAITSGGRDGFPDAHPGGHGTAGFTYLVNHDCCVSSSWDAGQWLLRSATSPLTPWDLIKPILTPQEISLSDHASWNNAQPAALVPFISATYRYGINVAAWRGWDDEIIAIETNAPAGTGATVWRFAHHRSDVASDVDPSYLSFWYTPRPNVSPDGRWVMFTSNWEKTLGFDPRDKAFREDVFLVQLQ